MSESVMAPLASPFKATERWLPIPGYEGCYEVSDLGRVYSIKSRRVLRPGTNGKKGYLMVILAPRRKHYVHQLVAEAFVGSRPPGQVVRHRDGNRRNNAATNLEWGTHGDNELDKVRHGTHQMASKTHCKYGHEFTPENTYVNPNRGGRACRKCSNASAAAWGKRNPEYREVRNARKRTKTQRPGWWWASRTHCVNGHEFTPENTRIQYRADGSFKGRVCKTCKRDGETRRRERNRQAKAA